jgi:hypothetical protein
MAQKDPLWYKSAGGFNDRGFSMIIFIRRIGFMVVMAVSVLGATILVGITEAANAQ